MRVETFSIDTEGSLEGASLTTYIIDSKESLLIKKRPLVFICPGGGYADVSEREGEVVALQFLSMGYHAAVLHYSVRPAVYPTQLLETASAWKFLCDQADEWNIQKDKMVIFGCSAGGHLAASYGIFCEEESRMEAVGAQEGELRPAGMILCYPVISSGQYAHKDSFTCLLGEDYEKMTDNPLLKKMSLELQVTEDTPPAFIWHTYEDDLVPVENSLLFAAALKAVDVSCELHIFPRGGHGLSLANELSQDSGGYGVQQDCQTWIPLVRTWLKNTVGLGE